MADRLRVVIRGNIAQRLQQEITDAGPLEEGAFLLADLHDTSEGWLLHIDTYVEPLAQKWRIQEWGRLSPTTDYMSHAAGLADQQNRIPVFLHSHPEGPLDLSEADEWAHEAWAPFFVKNVGRKAFASFIWTHESVIGDLWIDGRRIAADVVHNATLPPVFTVRTPRRRFPPNRFSRQVLAWRDRRQGAIEQSHVAVIGAGGIGSAVIEQISRAGVGTLTVIDGDHFEESNLNRLIGSTFADVAKRPWKTDIQARHVKAFAETKIYQERKDVQTVDEEVLLAADVIVGCTDNAGSRAWLNEFARTYGTPYIDAGCKAASDRDGIRGLWLDVRRILDGGPCLWCMGVLDAVQVAADNLPEEVVDDAVRDGYVDRPDVQASLASLTTAAGSLAASQVLAYLVGDRGEVPSLTVMDVWRSQFLHPTTQLCTECNKPGTPWETPDRATTRQLCL